MTMTKTAKISPQEFQLILQSLSQLGPVVAGMKLDEFIEQISLVEAVGPLVIPQLLESAMPTVSAIRAMAEGLRAFQRSLPPAMRRPLHQVPAGGVPVDRTVCAHGHDTKYFCQRCWAENSRKGAP